jgi:hypothetical protein
MRHNPRCRIFNEPPTLRDPSDCNCGAIPRLTPGLSLEQAIAKLTLRKQNLDHIYEGSSATDAAFRSVREEELDVALDVLRQIRL